MPRLRGVCKIFRETKESELQNLLRSKRELESKLAKVGASMFDDLDCQSRIEASAGKKALLLDHWFSYSSLFLRTQDFPN